MTTKQTDDQAAHVIAALARVMAELGGIGKDNKSPQGYQYRGIEQITARAQTLFAKHGIVCVPTVQHMHMDDQLNAKGLAKPGWTDCHVSVRFRFYGPGGVDDYVDAVTVGIGRDNSDKGSNKAVTQAFKYALLQVLCIGDASGDSDAADDTQHRAEPAAAQQPAGPVVSAGIANKIRKRLEEVGRTLGAYPDEWVDAGLPPLAGMGTLPQSRRAEAEAILAKYEQAAAEPQPEPEQPASDVPAYDPDEEPF